MNSHELARILLSQPDMPVVAHANNHTSDASRIDVGILKSTSFRPRIVIGNFTPWYINCSNYWVDKSLTQEYPPEAYIPDSGSIRRAIEEGDERHPTMSRNLQLLKESSANLVARALE